jgi:Lectin C-type domain
VATARMDESAIPRLDGLADPQAPSPQSSIEPEAEGPDGGSDPTPAIPELPDAAAPEPEPEPDPVAEPSPVCGALESLGPNGNCFVAVAQRRSGPNARLQCRARGDGWDLAAIRSPAVNEFVTGLTSEEVWIGGSDAANEGIWRWVSDGTLFWRGTETGNAVNGAYANWNPDEPNGGATSDCMRLVPRVGGSWADFECSSLLGSVCEGPTR